MAVVAAADSVVGIATVARAVMVVEATAARAAKAETDRAATPASADRAAETVRRAVKVARVAERAAAIQAVPSPEFRSLKAPPPGGSLFDPRSGPPAARAPRPLRRSGPTLSARR